MSNEVNVRCNIYIYIENGQVARLHATPMRRTGSRAVKLSWFISLGTIRTLCGKYHALAFGKYSVLNFIWDWVDHWDFLEDPSPPQKPISGSTSPQNIASQNQLRSSGSSSSIGGSSITKPSRISLWQHLAWHTLLFLGNSFCHWETSSVFTHLFSRNVML